MVLAVIYKGMLCNYQRERGKGSLGSGSSLCEGTGSCNRLMFADQGVAVARVGAKATRGSKMCTWGCRPGCSVFLAVGGWFKADFKKFFPAAGWIGNCQGDKPVVPQVSWLGETGSEMGGYGNTPSVRSKRSGETSPSPETFRGGNIATGTGKSNGDREI